MRWITFLALCAWAALFCLAAGLLSALALPRDLAIAGFWLSMSALGVLVLIFILVDFARAIWLAVRRWTARP